MLQNLFSVSRNEWNRWSPTLLDSVKDESCCTRILVCVVYTQTTHTLFHCGCEVEACTQATSESGLLTAFHFQSQTDHPAPPPRLPAP